MTYHGDYYWDQATKTCMNYAYGESSYHNGEKYQPIRLECEMGTPLFYTMIAVPAALLIFTIFCLLVCHKNIYKCCI